MVTNGSRIFKICFALDSVFWLSLDYPKVGGGSTTVYCQNLEYEVHVHYIQRTLDSGIKRLGTPLDGTALEISKWSHQSKNTFSEKLKSSYQSGNNIFWDPKTNQT